MVFRLRISQRGRPLSPAPALGMGPVRVLPALERSRGELTPASPASRELPELNHWTAGIEQGMLAVLPPPLFPTELFSLILWTKGKFSTQVFVEEGRRTLTPPTHTHPHTTPGAFSRLKGGFKRYGKLGP